MSEKPFLTDVTELRRRARQHIQEGAVTEGYRGDRDTVIKLLNEALATELVCPSLQNFCSTRTRSRVTPTSSPAASCSSAARRTSILKEC